MENLSDLLEETISHFNEGALSVKAFTDETAYIITKVKNSDDFWVTIEEPGFPKTRTSSLKDYFPEVFGIEAHY